MAQAVSAAASPRVLPLAPQGERLEGRIVNHLPPHMREALETTEHVAEILSLR